MPRSKPLLAWEPLPYIVLFVAALALSTARPDSLPVVFWSVAPVAALALVYFILSLARERRLRESNPNGNGELSSLAGLEIRQIEGQAGAPVTTVAESGRHQPEIDLIRIHEGDRAVLVPRATRWLGRRYRVGVELVAGDRVRRAGFLPEAAEKRFASPLDELRARGVYVSVPARITGTTRPFGVDLELAGLAQLDEGELSSR
ncbi:hypothetical protein [Agromyces atrinae]|uniref:Uncharacterized protein n=1 Tax=Agromyces atrinae TaxID=592376 RepID=A0A4Q2M2Y5_9MICO|nr:hypothetical protein [Agromyces atrinae]NYD65818.1 hypothetical protein [Agromyces atrinae]RXZ86169.1 hypothetical protein ESP50_10355 [Agromyces atrinae]